MGIVYRTLKFNKKIKEDYMFNEGKTTTAEALCVVSRRISEISNMMCGDMTIFQEAVHDDELSMDNEQHLELNFNLK
jgi:hypothetical protein